MYRRLAHHRTLKTRARLLEKIRRRGKWDWDVSQKPFFTPKHIRLASYWNGIGRPRATSREINEDDVRRSEADASHEQRRWPEDDAGYELSRREKEWKEQMAAMRRRIEQDPYEAVFGRRFQPFWDPISTWMQNGVNNGIASRTASTKKVSQMDSNRSERSEETQPTSKISPKTWDPENRRKDADADVIDTPEGQLTNYSYSSSTSWDSVSNKARRQEWDSITKQTRHYEYDPISNRMVKVEQPRRTEIDSTSKKSTSTTPPSLNSSPQVMVSESVKIPVKKNSEVCQAIPVPTQNSDSKTSVYFPSLLNSAAPTIPAPAPSRPSTVEKSEPPISREFEQDLDTLTADDVRASMGSKPGKKHRQSGIDFMLNTLGAEHARPPVKSQWDQAEDQVMLERELEKLRIAGFNQSSDAENVSRGKTHGASPKSPTLQPALDRLQKKQNGMEAAQHDGTVVQKSAESSVEMDSGSIPRDWAQQAELLQSDRVDRTSGNLGLKPRLQLPHWMRNANLSKVDALLQEEIDLQKRHMDSNEDRYARKISDLRTELDAAYKQSSVQAQMQVERIRALEAELQHARKDTAVKDDGDAAAASTRWKSESEKYQQKIAGLRKELDTSFKQSSIASEMHLDRIRQLENDLKCAQETAASDRRLLEDLRQGGLKPEQVMDGIREAVSNIFSKNTAAFEVQTERVKGLVDRLQQMQDNLEAPKSEWTNEGFMATPASPELQRAEGDFCANVTKFAGEDSKWYKRPAVKSTAARDQSLEREIQDVYEEHYGPIDAQHRQASAAQERRDAGADAKSATPVIEIESPVDLGDALAAYEKKQSYSFARDNLSTEIAREEKEAHERLSPTESSSNVWFEDRLYSQVPPPQKVNPIDGTGASVDSSRYSYAPDTGSFASPTGFVGDRIWDDTTTTPVPDGQQTDYTRQVESSGSASSAGTSSIGTSAKEQQPLRVRREERIFTGTLNSNADPAASEAAPQGYSRHHGRRHDGAAHLRRGRRESLLGGMSQQQQQRRRRARRRAIRWVLGLGLSATALAYGVGTLAQRQGEREMEAWERMLQAAERVDANRGGREN